jgi:hypothetical protein
MSSINNGINFIYNNKSSEEFGVFLCSGFGSSSRASNVENRTISTSKNSLGTIFDFHGVTYDSPLSFDIIIVNQDEHTIDSVYYMMIGKNVSQGMDLKKEGYFYHDKYGWIKKILANQKEMEETKCIRRFRIRPRFVGSL